MASEVTLQQISKNDTIIVIIGSTGAGKSTFVDLAVCVQDPIVGHNLWSETQEVRAYRTSHNQESVIFLDVPGFNNSSMSDTKVLTAVAEWLTNLHKRQIPLAGIVYLHKISENRMTGSLMQTLDILSSLCGMRVMENVSILTSMWDEVEYRIAVQRERELKNTFFKEMVAHGCEVTRFEKTPKFAWGVAKALLRKDPCQTLHIQDEMGRQGKQVEDTEAGKKAKSTGIGAAFKRFFSGLFSRHTK